MSAFRLPLFGNLGNAYAALHDINQAIRCYQQQLQLARKIGDQYAESSAFGNLGLNYAVMGPNPTCS